MSAASLKAMRGRMRVWSKRISRQRRAQAATFVPLFDNETKPPRSDASIRSSSAWGPTATPPRSFRAATASPKRSTAPRQPPRHRDDQRRRRASRALTFSLSALLDSGFIALHIEARTRRACWRRRRSPARSKRCLSALCSAPRTRHRLLVAMMRMNGTTIPKNNSIGFRRDDGKSLALARG